MNIELTETQARMLLTLLEARDDEYFHEAELALRHALKRERNPNCVFLAEDRPELNAIHRERGCGPECEPGYTGEEADMRVSRQWIHVPSCHFNAYRGGRCTCNPQRVPNGVGR